MDKVVHFTAFFILAFLLSAYKSHWLFIRVILSLFLVGLSIEILQETMPFHRSFDVKDLIANTFGSIFGFLFFNKFIQNRLNK